MLFKQEAVAAILDCSEKLLERNRWNGSGISFIKIESMVRYKKKDILDYINKPTKTNAS